MPLENNMNNFYDFELFFEKNCDIDSVIDIFFSKYSNIIKGDKEYISYAIKKTIFNDVKILNDQHEKNKLYLCGKISYVKHDVIPEQNNGKNFYIYCINSFI